MNLLSDSGLTIVAEDTEYQLAKESLFKTSWLETVVGKIVYIPCRYLNELPNFYSYKIIYINEDITEIEPSTNSNLVKKRNEKSISVEVLSKYEKDKTVIEMWIESQPGIAPLYINVNEINHSPDDISTILSDFFNHKIKLV
jgi:hypothetical protein